jgi:hypothetical protein
MENYCFFLGGEGSLLPIDRNNLETGSGRCTVWVQHTRSCARLELSANIKVTVEKRLAYVHIELLAAPSRMRIEIQVEVDFISPH